MPCARVSSACLLGQPHWATSLPGAGPFGGSGGIIAIIALVSLLGRDLHHSSVLVRGTPCALLSPPSGTSWVRFSGCLSKSCWPAGAKELLLGWGYPVDHGFGPGCLWAASGAVGHLQGGDRDVLEGRVVELSLPHVQWTSLIRGDQESSLCFKVCTRHWDSGKFRCCHVPPGRRRRDPSVMV